MARGGEDCAWTRAEDGLGPMATAGRGLDNARVPEPSACRIVACGQQQEISGWWSMNRPDSVEVRQRDRRTRERLSHSL